MPSTFSKLAPELLGHIISYIDTPKDICSLSLSCRGIHDFIEKEGWRTFVQRNFPSIKPPPHWQEAAHALTTLAKNWNQRAFVGTFIEEPYKDVVHLPHGRQRTLSPFSHEGRIPGNTQSMGYQPVIDCATGATGSSWSSQREVLALGTGAELQLRVRSMGRNVRRNSERERGVGKREFYNQFGHRESWITWKDPTHWEGKDDITALIILRHGQDEEDEHGMKHRLIVGRAGGDLQKVTLSRKCGRISVYETNNRPVRSAHVSTSETPLLAACLADRAIALYNVDSDSDAIAPVTETSIPQAPGTIAMKTWTNRFLTSSRLAIGHGPSKKSIRIYDVTPSGLSSHPICDYGHPSVDWVNEQPGEAQTSVYSLMPLSADSRAGSAAGGLFLSGWYTGIISLHDLRSNCESVSTFFDPLEPDSAIYSLLPFGGERFVAGGSRHGLIKVFDLRMPGQRRYHHMALNTTAAHNGQKLRAGVTSTATETTDRSNFNLFLATNGHHLRGPKRFRASQSPVYSLAASNSFSPVFYAGLENNIMEVDLVSGMDKHPDPMFEPVKPMNYPPPGDQIQRWLDPEKKCTNMGLVEHNDSTFSLRSQRNISASPVPVTAQDDDWKWDYRWHRDASRRDARQHYRQRARGGGRGRGRGGGPHNHWQGH